MDTWKHWYQNFLINKNKKNLEAFAKGLEGKILIEELTFSNKYRLSINSGWNEFIHNVNSSEINSTFSFNNKLIFDEELLNLALVKAIKNLKQIYPYSENTLNRLLYKKLDPNLSAKEILRVLREPPSDWFDICSSCENINEDGWTTCKYCGLSFEESLE